MKLKLKGSEQVDLGKYSYDKMDLFFNWSVPTLFTLGTVMALIDGAWMNAVLSGACAVFFLGWKYTDKKVRTLLAVNDSLMESNNELLNLSTHMIRYARDSGVEIHLSTIEKEE